MDTPTPPSNRSWRALVRRAAAEIPPPDLDVRFSVRQRIAANPRVVERHSSVLDEIAVLARGSRGLSIFGAAAAILALLAWQLTPAVREISFAIELQSQLQIGP